MSMANSRIEPHTPIVSWTFKVGEISCSNQCAKNLHVWQKDESCQNRNWIVGLQTSVRCDWQVSWVLLIPKYILGIQIAAMFYFKHSFHYRSMFQCQKSRFSHAMNTDKTSLDPIGRKMVQLAPTMLAWEHQTTECSCCHCQFTGKEQEDQCYSHQCKRNKQLKMIVGALLAMESA